jgi:hypothetical protein
MKTDSKVDKLIMLLSTDWFFPYWSAIGLYMDDEGRRSLQGKMRDIVRDLMSGATEYWLISFSKERITRTQQLLYSVLQRVGVAPVSADRIRQLIGEAPQSSLDDRTAWLLRSITEMLFEGALDDENKRLDPAIKQVVVEGWSKHESVDIDFEGLSGNAHSAWDRYVASLTPGLPTYLPDYVSVHLVKRNQFDSLRDFLATALTRKQQTELMAWYGSIAQSLTGEPVILPSTLS